MARTHSTDLTNPSTSSSFSMDLLEESHHSQSVTPSTRHQEDPDSRPRDSRSEPHSPALKTSRAALVAHAAGARAATGGETRARERRTPGERRHRPQGGGARGLVPEAERDSAETAGPLPAAAEDLFDGIVLCRASDECRERKWPRAARASSHTADKLPDLLSRLWR